MPRLFRLPSAQNQILFLLLTPCSYLPQKADVTSPLQRAGTTRLWRYDPLFGSSKVEPPIVQSRCHSKVCLLGRPLVILRTQLVTLPLSCAERIRARPPTPLVEPCVIMSLVSGPGRGSGVAADQKLYVQKHVDYIKSLDTVRFLPPARLIFGLTPAPAER